MLNFSFFRGLFYGLFFSSFLWAGIFYTVKTIANIGVDGIEAQAPAVTPVAEEAAIPIAASTEY